MSTLSAIAAFVAAAALCGCLKDPEDPARLWSGQTAVGQTTPAGQIDSGVQTAAAIRALAPSPTPR